MRVRRGRVQPRHHPHDRDPKLEGREGFSGLGGDAAFTLQMLASSDGFGGLAGKAWLREHTPFPGLGGSALFRLPGMASADGFPGEGGRANVINRYAPERDPFPGLGGVALFSVPGMASLDGFAGLDGAAGLREHEPFPGLGGTALFVAPDPASLDGFLGLGGTAALAVQSTLAYLNGYGYRRELVLPPMTDLAADTLVDFPLLLSLSGTWLQGTGGKVASVAGGVLRDVRFELEDGTKLDHQVVVYDGTAGTAKVRLRLPSWATGSQFRCFMYYGKAGLVAVEENVSGVWRGAAAVLNPVTGADLTGNGRSLAPVAGAGGVATITSATLDWNTFQSRAGPPTSTSNLGSDGTVFAYAADGTVYCWLGDGRGFDATAAVRWSVVMGKIGTNLVGTNLVGGGGTPAWLAGFPIGSDFANDPSHTGLLRGKVYGADVIGSTVYMQFEDDPHARWAKMAVGGGALAFSATSMTGAGPLAAWIEAAMVAGREYADWTDDAFAYFYRVRQKDQGADATWVAQDILLRRILKTADRTVDTNFAHFTGRDGAGVPSWSASAASAVPWHTIAGGVDYRVTATWIAALGRMVFIASKQNVKGTIQFWEAAKPWAVPRLVQESVLSDPQGRVPANWFSAAIHPASISADGRTFLLALSGSTVTTPATDSRDDALVFVQATLAVSGGGTGTGIAAGTLDGMPAGVYAAGSYMRGPVAWLAGLSALTIEGVLHLSSLAEGTFVRAGGSTPGTSDAIIFTDAVSFIDANRTNCWSYGCGRGATNETSSGPADSLALTRQHLHATYANGQQVELHVGEAKLPAAYSLATPLTGTFAVVAGDNLSVGMGTGTQTSAAIGSYLPVIFWPRVLSDTWIKVAARCQLDPAGVTGIGDEDTPATGVLSPVAVPLRVAITAQADIDALASCYDPDTPASMVLEAPGTGLHGTYSLVAGKIRAAPQASYNGPDEVSYAVSKGSPAKRSASKLILAISSGTPPPPPPLPEIPTGLTAKTVPGDYASVALAIAACPLSGGWHIKCAASATSYGTLTISKLFTSPVLIDVAGAVLGAKGVFIPTGTNIWVRGFDMGNVGGSTQTMTGSNNRWLRCRVSNYTGGATALRDFGTDNYTAYCDFINCASALHLDSGGSLTSGPRRATAHRNFFSGTDGAVGTNGHESIKMGLNQSGRGIDTGNRATFNYFLNCNQAGGENETLGIKSGGNWVEGNTLIGCRDLSKRNGGVGDTIISNWVQTNRSTNGFDLKDYGGLFAGNYTDNAIGVDGGNCAKSPTESSGPLPDGKSSFPRANGYKLVGNIGKMRVGQNYVNDQLDNTAFKPINIRVEEHSGGITLYGATISGGASTPASVAYTPARKMLQSEAGTGAAFTGWTK